MLLDQQIPLEVAFAGPKKIADRMGGVDAREIADYDPEKFAALCAERPAVHRFPGSMAKRIQAFAQIIVDRYGGDAAAVWAAGDPDGAEVLARLKELPGFGDQKARIFLALLGKQYGVTPKGWREAAGDYGKAGSYLSVADIVDAGSLEKVRSYKKQMKAARGQERWAHARRAGDDPGKGRPRTPRSRRYSGSPSKRPWWRTPKRVCA